MEQKPAEQKSDAPPAAAEPKPVPMRRQILLDEAKARYRAAIDSEIGMVERLVWFWSNHFCVSFDSTVMAGAYEREAIRPHVLGRFADMLLAAESHPAMLIYLDNAQSIGPNSVAGVNRDRGLNENLAREILELHTLGVRDRLCAGRRHQFRQGDHRLDGSSARRQSGSRRRVRVQQALARARAADADRQRLSGHRCRPRPQRARRSGAPSRHRPACGGQAGAALHRRRSAAATGRAVDRALPRYRGRPQGGHQDAPWRARILVARSRPRSSARASGSWRASARSACRARPTA